ncbi:MHYT domain-containing protein [Pseudoroseicyclus aestuarii]|uniref:histidine kinase n=1 Tax=Pseudoroseicyclus aestuarii TaxID=1795041 RepID=A0A318SVI6_9RHOB|nr:MHYT domain-containing protein [Pseudoroseicyclus aestuarii]PYE83867.1 NO-binding membrane sensor protein with MHYT domain [Pseudoroseicyclus aestuarii]
MISTLPGQHDPLLIGLAGLLCLLGFWATARLFRRCRYGAGGDALRWSLLTGLTAGATFWCGHFLALMAYSPGVPVRLDPVLTAMSLVVAVLGACAGVLFAVKLRAPYGAILGGTIIGLAIAEMHYAGLLGYRVQGVVTWHSGVIAAHVFLAVALSVLALVQASRAERRGTPWMIGGFTLAVLGLHFVGMSGYSILPFDMSGDYVDARSFRTMALAMAGIAMLILLGGMLSYGMLDRVGRRNTGTLLDALEKAERANRDKSEFVLLLAQELRTTLSIVSGYARLLSSTAGRGMREPAASDERARALGEKIGAEARQLLTLLEEVVAYVGAEAGETALSRTSFSVRDMLQEAAGQACPLGPPGTVTLSVECEEITAYADRALLLQAVVTLLQGALLQGEARRIAIRGRVAKEGFRIEVEDGATSVSECERARQAGAAQEHQPQGGGQSGLTLVICRTLAAAQGGHLTLLRGEAGGSVVRLAMPEEAIVRLPAVQVPSSRAPGLRLAG